MKFSRNRAEKADQPSTPESGDVEMVEKQNGAEPDVYGESTAGWKTKGLAAYNHDHLHPTMTQAERDDANPNIHNKMNLRLFLALTAMSFCWVGSQIPLYLYGSVLPLIYSEVGGAAGRWVWMIIAYLIPLAAVCPFVGALSDIFGRKSVAMGGQILLIIGPIVVSTAKGINVAIGGMVISGLGAGLNELIALAGTSELVPVAKRGVYVGGVVFTILPFCASGAWAALIGNVNWRWIGLLVSLWNLIGFVMVALCYKEPIRERTRPAKQILAEIDYIGAFLSITGVLLFMMGMQWGAVQYTWGSPHVLAPFIIGAILLVAFFVWELVFCKNPLVPAKLFSKDKRTMILILCITFLSGGNFFAVLLIWPTQAHDMYNPNEIQVGLRTLPVGFGIIFGAVVALVLIGVTKGKTKILMMFWTAWMTAFVGAMSVARADNLTPTVIPLILFASIGVGGVIIPCSIIAQIVCPVELIGTVTAITLSIRYIGGAVGFTAYYNVLYHKFDNTENTTKIGFKLIGEGVTGDYKTLVQLITFAAQAQYADLRNLIASSPNVMNKDTAFETILKAVEESFANAYKWPYFISIAFGVACFICACGLRDVRRFM